ncbi:MAG: hypothetical protein MMC33_000959 [Icmadophila ericetorum]|nr:hypothetical protein [Icmadophila ericetorum]
MSNFQSGPFLAFDPEEFAKWPQSPEGMAGMAVMPQDHLQPLPQDQIRDYFSLPLQTYQEQAWNQYLPPLEAYGTLQEPTNPPRYPRQFYEACKLPEAEEYLSPMHNLYDSYSNYYGGSHQTLNAYCGVSGALGGFGSAEPPSIGAITSSARDFGGFSTDMAQIVNPEVLALTTDTPAEPPANEPKSPNIVQADPHEEDTSLEPHFNPSDPIIHPHGEVITTALLKAINHNHWLQAEVITQWNISKSLNKVRNLVREWYNIDIWPVDIFLIVYTWKFRVGIEDMDAEDMQVVSGDVQEMEKILNAPELEVLNRKY